MAPLKSQTRGALTAKQKGNTHTTTTAFKAVALRVLCFLLFYYYELQENTHALSCRWRLCASCTPSTRFNNILLPWRERRFSNASLSAKSLPTRLVPPPCKKREWRRHVSRASRFIIYVLSRYPQFCYFPCQKHIQNSNCPTNSLHFTYIKCNSTYYKW